MIEVDAGALIYASGQLERLQAVFSVWERTQDPGTPSLDSDIDRKGRNTMAANLMKVVESAGALGAPLTKLAAERAIKRLRSRNNNIKYGELKTFAEEMKNRFKDEVGTAKLYSISEASTKYYKPKGPLFGDLVELRLPQLSDDISEAGKCFGVARYTACGFHLMRAMEAAVKVLSTELGVNDVNRDWGTLLSDMNTRIALLPKGEKRDQWSSAHANLYHVKQAWRNPTMHPKRTYTEEEAYELLSAMKAFLKQLAALMPESIEEILS